MKSKLKPALALASASMVLLFASSAWSADAPAQAETKPATSTSPEKAKKRTVTPHNHMRDAKGQWVPGKKSQKDVKKGDDEGSKTPADGEAKK
jgi:hypothetical protein